MLVRVVGVVLLADVVEHQDVGQRLEPVREVAGHVDGGEVVVTDVLGEHLASVAIECHHARTPLQADEEVVLAPLVEVQPANRALARERDVRLPDRLRQPARARDLGQPAAVVLEAAQRDGARPVGTEVRAAHALDHLVVRIDRLAGVPPVAVEDVVLERPLADVVVVDVGDLELAAGGGLELLDDVEDIRVVAVHARDGQCARGVERLLDDLRDATVNDPRHAEVTQMLRLTYVREQYASPHVLRLEVAHHLRDRLAEDVVGEHDDDAIVAGEVARESERLGDAAGAFLLRIAELVSEVALKVFNVVGAGHEQQLADTGLAQKVDGPLDHRLVADGQQVLVGDAGQRIEARPRPAREDNAFHRRDAKRPRSAAMLRSSLRRRPALPLRALPATRPESASGSAGRNGSSAPCLRH